MWLQEKSQNACSLKIWYFFALFRFCYSLPSVTSVRHTFARKANEPPFICFWLFARLF